MKNVKNVFILSIIFLFLVTPVFAQEENPVDEDLVITDEPTEGVITGRVISLDIDSSLITVKTDEGKEKVYSIVGGETILWRGIDDIEISDINIDEEAEIGYYTNEEGNLIASWVDILIEEKEILTETQGKGSVEAGPKGSPKDSSAQTQKGSSY